jgi:hypothetical protein
MELLNQAEVPQAHQGGAHLPLEPEPDKQRELRTSRAREHISPARARGFVCVAVPQIRVQGAPKLVGVFVPAWSRIEPGAVTDAALCRYLPLLAEQET